MVKLDELLGTSPSMQALRESVERFLARQGETRRSPSILLLGETGTGKGLLAHLLHRGSPRAGAPFVDVNCAAIPDTMLEAELFGYERGAFTDARQAKPGLFQAAHRGTIFLDEIALLGEGLQGKLLKILEDRAVRRLGSTRSEPVDVWVVAATSEDLSSKARDGGFREDLYHRLAVITLKLPPLRERGDDVLLLADRFLKAACADYGLPAKTLSSEARSALLQYWWPGNVRELSNVMERVALLCEDSVVGVGHLALQTDDDRRDGREHSAVGSLDGRRQEELLTVLTQTGWNITRAASQLMIARNTLRARIRRYGLKPPGAEAPRHRQVTAPKAVVAAPPAASPRAPHGGIVWESRRLSLLRAEVSGPYDDAFKQGVRRAFEVVAEKLHSFGGRIEDATPTAIMAVFGLDPVDEAPRRAANAALAIQRALRGAGADGPAVSLALHFAEVLVGRMPGALGIDAHARREAWTVLDSLNDLAKPDGIMASAAAAIQLKRRFELVPVHDGLDDRAGAAHRLVGPEQRVVPSEDSLGPFIGRHYELDVLRRRLAASIAHGGQAVTLVGEPGIGKSRLIREFGMTLEDRYRVLDAGCETHGRSFPHLPIIRLLDGVLGLNEADDPRVVRDVVSQRFASLGATAAADGVAAVLGLLHCLPEDDALFSLTPAQRRRRTLEAVLQLVIAESARQPLIVVIEDLQWIDPESEAILHTLVDRLPGARMFLLTSARPEYVPPWKGAAHVTELSLEPLSPASVHAALEGVLGHDPRLGTLKDLIVRRTEGNPFFVEETLRTLREARVIVGARGAYEVSNPIDAIQVPPTVQAVLSVRIDRLGVNERRLLQAAAVIGQNVPLDLLASIVDLSDAERDSSLLALERANFLHEARNAAAPTRLFTHALTCEVAHDSVVPEERRELHARLVRTFESMPADELLDRIDTVAHHAYEANMWEKAYDFYRQAAQRAINRSAYRAAVACLERAVSAVSKLSPTPQVLERAVDLRFDLRDALWSVGELSRGLDHLRKAQPQAEALGDQRRLARLFARTSFNALILGDNKGAREAGELALRLARAIDDAALQVDAHQYLGILHNSLGNYPHAVSHLEANLTALSSGRQHGRFTDYYAVHSRAWLVWALCELGDLERAATLATEAVAVAESSRQPYNVVASRWALGLLHLAKGEASLAIPELQRALAVCQAGEIAIWLRPTVALLGRACATAGRLAEGLSFLEQAMRPDENHVAVVSWETYLAEAQALAGRLDEAESHARHAADLARERNELGFLARAHYCLARIAQRRGATDDARAQFEHALRIARECGMRPLIADCESGMLEMRDRLEAPA